MEKCSTYSSDSVWEWRVQLGGHMPKIAGADYAGNDESQEGNNSVLAEMQMITIFANWQKLF